MASKYKTFIYFVADQPHYKKCVSYEQARSELDYAYGRGQVNPIEDNYSFVMVEQERMFVYDKPMYKSIYLFAWKPLGEEDGRRKDRMYWSRYYAHRPADDETDNYYTKKKGVSFGSLVKEHQKILETIMVRYRIKGYEKLYYFLTRSGKAILMKTYDGYYELGQ